MEARARPRRADARRGQGHRSSTSSPIPTIRSRTTAAPAPRSGATPKGAITHFVSAMGTTGTIMGVSRFLKEKNPADHDRRRAAGGRLADSRASASGRRRTCRRSSTRSARRPDRVRLAGRRRGHDAPARARGRHLRRHLVGRRVRGGAAHRARGRRTRRSCSSSAIAATATCRPACSRRDRRRSSARRSSSSTSRRCPTSPASAACHDLAARAVAIADVARLVSRSSGAQRRGSDFAAALPAARGRDRVRAARRRRRFASGRSASSTIPSPSSSAASSTASRSYTPQLVSWNGGGFDLPVLQHRALIHGVAAPRYWDWGDDDREFKFNNYLGRFHTRHLDLMDVLAMYQPRASAGSTRWRGCAAFPASSAWTAARSPPRSRAGELRRRAQLLRDRRDEHLPRSTSASA